MSSSTGGAAELPLEGADPPTSLYVHFPFCAHRCHYCDFSVHRTSTPPLSDWLDCLAREAEQWRRRTGWRSAVRLRTVFVGGGTPSLMGDGMVRLRDVLRSHFVMDSAPLEWTAESNPASLDERVATEWLEAGVNRLSIGIQSFDDEVLRWLGRLHDSAGARRALKDGRSAGFENLNADLIFGLPSTLKRDWQSEVAAALDAGVTHVSTYGLTAEPRTPLGRRVTSGQVSMVGDERYAGEYLTAVEALSEAGFVHYEVSNFALPGRECLHNWHYWDGSPYLGLGPSAHSYLGGSRLWNVFGWAAYRRVLAGDGDALEGHEVLGAGEGRLERLWLAFRTNRGLAVADDLTDLVISRAGDLLETWRRAGWVAADPTRVRLTAEGWLRMDELVAALAERVATLNVETRLRDCDGARESDRT
ncbi:MAG: radical SAM family heme chaperone HemW [Gemmatimonadetes bacterium]|nr:radical SAM family heme chaperone HemW [Gemmatimonadota bacterium]